ncbi:hypothetical protein CAOG_09217, partial [Capsaspora owczarzaki ATCC 30864]|uniref:hypothetical protein n=1 Tax=Capsaspora owczarzaki (strain ATCC 30864) TaxID=595528 RepID=UPI0003520B9D
MEYVEPHTDNATVPLWPRVYICQLYLNPMRRRPGTNTGIRNLTKSTCTRAAPRRAAHDPAGLD